VGIVAAVFLLQATNSITLDEAPVARDCAAWANQEIDSPSPARDQAFIDCIVRRDPAATPEELRHKLKTGDGDDLFSRLMTGESPPITPDSLENGDGDDSFNQLMTGESQPITPDSFENGDGDDLFNQLMTGESPPITPDSNCPYLRMAVQSPAGSDELDQKPMRDLFATALTQVGFQVVNADALHQWWASSLALDTGENSAAWTILVRAIPEIGNGAIQFTTVRKTVDGREGSFSGMQSLRAFAKSEAPEAARLAAEGVARELLPAAHRRCDEIDATLEETRIALEQLRSELTAEIERVRREKAEREKAGYLKQLEIEVEG
jgi:hypothetical protein